MRGEFDLIARYFAPLARDPAALGLKDDAALLTPPPGKTLALTLDTMIAGVHYLPEDPPESVGRKLLRVNLSDLAAMGAVPLGYLLSTAWPKDWQEDWIAGFCRGLAADQEIYEIGLLGGDTTSGPGPATLSLTAVGCVTPGHALTRGGAAAGDLVMVSGAIGNGALGLRALTGKLDLLSPESGRALGERYRVPEPRMALGAALAESGLATACLDVSDGLVADLAHIAEVSGLAAVVDAARVPLSAAVQEAVAQDLELFELALTGGDDYELCFTVPPRKRQPVQELAAVCGTPVTEIGRMEAGSGVRVLDRDGRELALKRSGWTHF